MAKASTTKESKSAKKNNFVDEKSIIITPTIDDEPPFVADEDDEVIEINAIPNKSELIEKEIAKFDPLVPILEEYKTKYVGLAIKNIDDEEGYKAVTSAIKEVRSKLASVESLRKSLKADSLAFGRAVDAKAKSIVATVEPIIEPLKKMKEDIDALRKAREEKIEAEKQQKIMARHNTLISSGCVLVQNEYVIDRLEYTCNEDGFITKINGEQECLHKMNIETMTDGGFNEFINTVNEILLKNNQSYSDAVEKQQNIYAEKARKKAQQDKEAAELKASMDALKAQIANLRISALSAIGLNLQQNYFYFIGKDLVLNKEQLTSMSQDEWDAKLIDLQNKLAAHKEAEDARQKQLIADAEAKAKAMADSQKQKEQEEAAAQIQTNASNHVTIGVGRHEQSTGTSSTIRPVPQNVVVEEQNNNQDSSTMENRQEPTLEWHLLQDKEMMESYVIYIKAVTPPPLRTEKYKNLLEKINLAFDSALE